MSVAAMDVPRPGAARPFAQMLLDGGVASVFQPIVDLDSSATVAFEALARGPEGPWRRPDVMFSTARELGLLAELDHACRISAVRAASRLAILERSTVFINVEPEVIDSVGLVELMMMDDVCGAGRVVLEVTERALARRPAELLRTVAQVRELGWGIALDDVGVEPASLAFMSLLEPDVVKLDLGLVQGRLGEKTAEVMHSVNAYAERSGALILAEGIETQTHLDNALALGATLGQGWIFGRPCAAPVVPPHTPEVIVVRDVTVAVGSVPPASPFTALPESTVLRRSPKRLLVELSKQLEEQAARIGETCVLASTFQHARHFTEHTQLRYRRLVDRVGFVCVLGEDIGREPVPGVRSNTLAVDDVVRDEWDLVALSPHFAVALLARDLGDQGPDPDRIFEYALTYDRETVVQAAHALLARVPPLTGSSRPGPATAGQAGG